jgi:3D (Asp-Asp-Asp) domain-containing protein
MRSWRALGAVSLLSAIGCATAGSSWMSEPLTAGADDEAGWGAEMAQPLSAAKPPSVVRQDVVVINEPGMPEEDAEREPGAAPSKQVEGRVLGSFRNTYYDFPSEAEHKGANVPLKDSRCKTIADVPRGFFEAVCVQGSGTLKRGSTVSFAKRDCECAEICPRTQQKICFDELDKARFPWGRGATGNPITPLLTVAVDTDVIPMNTPIYIPEFDGVARDTDDSARHDGCFVAQDRGMKIKGKHVDIFTGYEGVTKLWNRLVPSNKGVTVVLDSPRCARASADIAELPKR